MADLERDKELEEDDEFKTNAKPSTSRTTTTRICNRNVIYQCDDESEITEDSDDDEDSTEEYDGYSSPDIDYASLPNYD